ncbi:hypothetical protein [Anabaena sp. 90]|uniref:hypothetical protein n=1 Tax=Anabaena sp. 90 TaxID=46234 RepID=UPI00130DEE37|nr:hypothetical protein [Anabaena sp. 90]
MAKADQSLNLDFTGVAQANCLFTNIESGLVIAKGVDLGTVGSSSNATLGTVGGVAALPASFTAECNSQTAFFVDTPVAAASNPAFQAVSTKSVLADAGAGGATIEAYTASPAGGSVTSDQFLPVAAAASTDMTVDMNVQSASGVPVGIYKYTILVSAVPQ